jgi:alpha amylase-like protein
MIPRATYRLQFHKEFRFADAARLAPYLASLGISHIYASPYLKARSGSTHGYDIVDHRLLNPELGDQADFDRMITAFAENGLSHILDFVAQSHDGRRRRQPALARRARMGSGIQVRKLVRHRLGSGPRLFAWQTTGSISRQTIWHRARGGEPTLARPDGELMEALLTLIRG